MIFTRDDVLAAIREKYIAEAKKLFDLLKDSYAERISQVMLILQEVLDKKADENTLRRARVLLDQASYVKFVPGKETVLGKSSVQFVRTLVENIAEDAASKRSYPMTNEEIFKEYKFSVKAEAAFVAGVTIGELFVIQPDPFL